MMLGMTGSTAEVIVYDNRLRRHIYAVKCFNKQSSLNKDAPIGEIRQGTNICRKALKMPSLLHANNLTHRLLNDILG